MTPGDARLARLLVVQVAVTEVRDPQSDELGEAAVDPQVPPVPERIRAHPSHADQRRVPARVEPAVRDLDIVSHLGSIRCSPFPSPRLPGPTPSRARRRQTILPWTRSPCQTETALRGPPPTRSRPATGYAERTQSQPANDDGRTPSARGWRRL